MLTTVDIEHFDREGYLVIENIVDEGTLAGVRPAIEAPNALRRVCTPLPAIPQRCLNPRDGLLDGRLRQPDQLQLAHGVPGDVPLRLPPQWRRCPGQGRF